MGALRYMIVVGALLAGAGAGCTDASGPNSIQALFDASLKKWNQTGPPAYRMEVGRTCSCPLSPTAILVVRNGVVESRTYSDTGTPVPTDKAIEFPDVRTLFDLVRRAMRQQYYAFSVQYDPTYGHPASLQLDPTAATLEDNIHYQVVDLQPLANP